MNRQEFFRRLEYLLRGIPENDGILSGNPTAKSIMSYVRACCKKDAIRPRCIPKKLSLWRRPPLHKGACAYHRYDLWLCFFTNTYALQESAFFRRKRKLRNRMTFITTKNTARIISVRTGLTGASVASSISGKPKTMAGKF